jgi:hypothetical protein
MSDQTSGGTPEPEWRQRSDWAKGDVEEEGARTMGVSVASASLLSLVAAGLVVGAWFQDGFLWFFALIVGGVAIAFVWRVVRQGLRHRKFGRSRLLLQRTPLRAGERLTGRVRTGIPRTEPAPSFRVQVRCVRRWKEERGSSEDRKTEHHEEVLWLDGQATPGRLEAAPGGAVALAVPIEFDLPAGAQATTAIGRWEGIAWELKLNAELAGLDYEAIFELPVADV